MKATKSDTDMDDQDVESQATAEAVAIVEESEEPAAKKFSFIYGRFNVVDKVARKTAARMEALVEQIVDPQVSAAAGLLADLIMVDLDERSREAAKLEEAQKAIRRVEIALDEAKSEHVSLSRIGQSKTCSIHVELIKALKEKLSQNYQVLKSLDTKVNDKISKEVETLTNELNSVYSNVNDLVISVQGMPEVMFKNGTPGERPPPPPDANSAYLLFSQGLLPSFSGKHLDYPGFKKAWIEQVEKILPETARKGYLLKSIKDQNLRTSVDDDRYENVWHNLDKLFGRPSFIRDELQRSWEGMKVASSSQEFLKLILLLKKTKNVIESQDLNMSIDFFLSHFVQLVPASHRYQVYEIVHHEDGCDFSKLMSYLNMVSRYIFDSESRVKHDQELKKKITSSNEQVTSKSKATCLSVDVIDSKSCSICNKDSHESSQCFALKNMSLKDRAEKVKRDKLCLICANPGHLSRDCPGRGKSKCKECQSSGHLGWFHGVIPILFPKNADKSGKERLKAVVNTTGMGGEEDQEEVVAISNSVAGQVATSLPTQRITVSGQTALTLYDSGSNVSLIRKDFVRKLSLQPHKVKMSLVGIGNQETDLDTHFYMIKLKDNNGRIHSVKVYAAEDLTTNRGGVSVAEAARQFNLSEELLETDTSGPVDIILGADEIRIHPRMIEFQNKLGLYRSIFGKGYVVVGSLKDQVGVGEERKSFSCNRVEVFSSDLGVEVKGKGAGKLERLKEEMFWEMENLAVQPPKSCSNCMGCKECKLLAAGVSLIDKLERERIRKNLSFDEKTNTWKVNYPKVIDVSEIQSNKNQAIKVTERLETQLEKRGELDAFNQEFRAVAQRNVFKELTDAQRNEYSGPVFYSTLVTALKDDPESTTPIRICQNSALKFKGNSFNDFITKGPRPINNILDVTIRFQENQFISILDISKFYNRISSSEEDQNLRRVLWRFGDKTQPFKEFVTTTVAFGDKCSGSIAEEALRQTAEMFSTEYPAASEQIRQNSYVDDLHNGADTRSEVERLTQESTKILKFGGFPVKEPIFSGEKGRGVIKFLGTKWDVERDEIGPNIQINISDKKRGVREMKPLSLKRVREELPRVSKRVVWRMAMGIFDVLGLVNFFTIKFKFLMRVLCEHQINWDDQISSDQQEKLISIIEGLAQLEDLRRPRCLMARNAKAARMVVFSDGSTVAYSACVYVITENEEGVLVSLVMSKAKIAPKTKISVVRMELCGALLATRMMKTVTDNLKIRIEKKMFMTDSQVVLKMINSRSSTFTEYVGVRLGEIQRSTEPEEWFHCPGIENPADVGSRDQCKPEDLLPGGIVYTGPRWLKLPQEEWPVSQVAAVKQEELPTEEMTSTIRKMVNTIQGCPIEPQIDVSRFRNFKKPVRILSLCLKFIMKCRKIDHKDEARYRNEATLVFIWWDQAPMKAEKCKFKKFNLKEVDFQVMSSARKLKCISGRLPDDVMEDIYHKDLPVLPEDSEVGKKIVQSAHLPTHCGVDRCVHISRRTVWLVGARRAARNAVRNCFTCKRIFPQLMQQKMGQLPESRVTPSPPFFNTSVDFFGPLSVVDQVKRRCTGKGYGVIFVCHYSGAVHLELAEDYSAKAFLSAFQRFMHIRGAPRTVVSDPGSQLVCAAEELKNWKLRDEVKNLEEAITWHFIPANSQHQNGLAESMIKTTKRLLSIYLGNERATFGEMQTMLTKISSHINSRPIGLKATEDPDSLDPVTPNTLLMAGRPAFDYYQLDADTQTPLTRRLIYQENVVNKFHSHFVQNVLEKKIGYQKWSEPSRCAQVGDVCVMVDSNVGGKKFRLGLVTSVVTGRDGLVRRVQLRYRNPSSNVFMYVERAPQALALLVPGDYQPPE